MQTSRITNKVRLFLMSITILAIAAFSIFGAGWATPVRADGGSGTVPGSGGGNNNNTNGNGNGNTDNGSNLPGSGETCGAGPQTFSLAAPTSSVTSTLSIGIGTARLLSAAGGVGNGAVRILFVPITSFSAHLLAADTLPASPDGWTNVGCGVQTSGKVQDGQAVTYILKGQQVCFTLPVGAAAAYSSLRIAYFDTRLSRWVFLNTTVTATQACHSSFRFAPTTFALFGGA